jgi:hypothetical protein
MGSSCLACHSPKPDRQNDVDFQQSVDFVVLQLSNADKFVAERLRVFLGCQIEEVVDELNLTKKIISCHPSNLPLPDHVDCFVALNRSPSHLEGVHSTFDGSMILFENVVQVLHRSVSTAVAHCSNSGP